METFLMLIALMYILISSYLQVIIHEGGHLICGRISGYEFISFRIGNIMFLKENGVIKRKKFNIVGTGGQCLMAPPQKDSYNFPYVLCNLGGVLANLITAIIAIIIYKFIPDIKLVSLFLIIFSFFGLLFAILNGVPMKLGGIANDGYNILALKKSKTARHAFWSQLQINALLSQKELKKYIKSTYSYVSRKRLMYAYELLVNKDIEKAKKELDSFEKVSKTYPYAAEIQSERELLELIKSKFPSLI